MATFRGDNNLCERARVSFRNPGLFVRLLNTVAGFQPDIASDWHNATWPELEKERLETNPVQQRSPLHASRVLHLLPSSRAAIHVAAANCSEESVVPVAASLAAIPHDSRSLGRLNKRRRVGNGSAIAVAEVCEQFSAACCRTAFERSAWPDG